MKINAGKIHVISIVLIAVFAGCSKETGNELRDMGGGIYQLGSRSPRICLSASLFFNEMVEPESLLLENPCVLEFIPIAQGEARKDARFEVFGIVDGRVHTLHSGVPCFVGSKEFKGKNRLALWKKTVCVDLSPFQGKRISVKWTLRGSAGPGAAGNLKIRRKREGGSELPHVLFVCSDTHRYDHAFGEEGCRLMPFLHAFKKNAVVYHRVFSSASWTMPALASVLTGLSPQYHLTGFRTDGVAGEEFSKEAVPPGRFAFKAGDRYSILTCFPGKLVTLTEKLRGQGYATAMVVSSPLYKLSGLLSEGLDFVVDLGVSEGDEVNSSALAIMESRPANRPLFLLVHYMDVHQWQPWYFRKRYPDLSPRKNPDKVLECYGQAVRDLDASLKVLLDAWDEKAGLDNSMTAFFSDHGEQLLDFGTSMLGHGNSMNEKLLHIPLMVRYPASVGLNGKEADAPVSLIDLPATVLDLVGIPTGDGEIQGRSLLSSESVDRTFYADFQLYKGEMSSVRQGPYKLVIDFDKNIRSLVDTSELNDPDQALDNEPMETRLWMAFEKYREDAKKRTTGLKSTLDVDQDEAMKGLNELGYVR